MAKAPKPPKPPDPPKPRRVKLHTIEATSRESARTYRELVNGKTTIANAQARSKLLVNHNGILTRAAEQRQLAELIAQLKVLNGEDA